MHSESIEDHYEFIDGKLKPRNREVVIVPLENLVTLQQIAQKALEIFGKELADSILEADKTNDMQK